MNIERPKSKQPIPPDAKKVFRGILFDVYQWEQEMFDGSRTIFEKLKRPDTVIIFPVLNDGRILLIKEEQPGSTPVLGIPGGRIDEGEDVLEAAKRELLEESGYTAEEFILWDAQHPVKKLDWVIYTLIAKGLKRIASPKSDAGEKINFLPVSFEELMEITTKNGFSERTTVTKFLEAKYDKKKYQELKELFKP